MDNKTKNSQNRINIFRDGNKDEKYNYEIVSEYNSERSGAIEGRVLRMIALIISSIAVMSESGNGIHIPVLILFVVGYEFAYYRAVTKSSYLKYNSLTIDVNDKNIRKGYDYVKEYSLAD